MNNNDDGPVEIPGETLANWQAIGRVQTEDETGEGTEENGWRCHTSATKDQRRSDTVCYWVLQSNVLCFLHGALW
jgi:hypothetical protein